MNDYAFGAGITLALAIVGWAAYAEIRIRSLQNSLLKSQEVITDAGIKNNVNSLSGPELDALLSTRLGSAGPGKPKS